MVKKFLVYFPIISFFLLVSCRASRTPVISASQKTFTSVSQKTLTDDYVEKYKDMAIREMMRTGVPASITLAQGMIESDYGRSSLATKANNHFGIKCHSDWNGAGYYQDDDKRNECFRKYNNPDESFRDHSDFLVSGSRYTSLFELDPTDYKGWAQGLKKAGYATNPIYPELLIRKIEDFGLSIYDNYSAESDKKMKIVALKEDETGDNDSISIGILNKNSNQIAPSGYSRIFVRNRIYYIITRDGDTFESLLEEFQLLRFELQKYNELPQDFEIAPGQILYLQLKRNRAEVGNDYYTLKDGDTIYQISQLYGIKIKDLLEMNRIQEGSEPLPGQKLWLRTIKPQV